MKHATSRILFGYWDGLRGERSAPERGDVRPARIRQILADTFVLGAEVGEKAAFRLAGTRCAALLGQDLKGVPFASLWKANGRSEAETILDTVLGDTSGIVAGLVGTSTAGDRIGLELLLLPLRHRGAINTRAIGSLAPLAIPSWLGLVPLLTVEAQSLRVIRTGREAHVSAPAMLSAAGRRSRFVVLEGGLGRADASPPACA